MKIQKLKEIIREEVKKALRKENGTKTAPVKPGTAPVKPGTAPVKPGTKKSPYVDPNVVPKERPEKAKTQQKEEITAKDFVNKYNKLKRK